MASMEKLLEGKVAIVTGAGRGIGRGIALELAREASSVMLADIDDVSARTVAREIHDTHGTQSLFFLADVTAEGDRKNLLEYTIASFERIDILINNAAIVHFDPDIRLNPPEEETRLVWETNFHAPRILSHMVADFLEEFNWITQQYLERFQQP